MAPPILLSKIDFKFSSADACSSCNYTPSTIENFKQYFDRK